MPQSGVLKTSGRTPCADNAEIVWLRRRLLRWGTANQRSFPWRQTGDPLRVLIAEILLRRTRAEQVEAPYRAILASFPDVDSLANATSTEVAVCIAPLGLPQRAEDLVACAREIRDRHDGRVPRSRKGLTALPGVGDYVAGAVLSVAFNRREWIVDTNVARVFTRYFGLMHIGEPRNSVLIRKLSREFAQSRTPRRANLALLDHGALVCSASRPRCGECVLATRCAYGNASRPVLAHASSSRRRRSSTTLGPAQVKPQRALVRGAEDSRVAT